MPRHVPLRMCVACRTPRPKSELVRVVRRPDGQIELDPTGKLAGRGAYVCPQEECMARAVGKQALRRALGESLPAEVAKQLARQSQDD